MPGNTHSFFLDFNDLIFTTETLTPLTLLSVLKHSAIP